MIQQHHIIGQTPLDEEEKRALIPTALTLNDLNYFERENILEARKWLMQARVLKKQTLFDPAFILRLHKRMLQYVWKWAGDYRRSNKNIGVDYYQIAIELRKLLDDSQYWLENQTYSITELAVIFHHRLVKIHLFPNGNGRHARLFADAIIAQRGETPLTWGGNSTLASADDIRKQYINGLRKADVGSYTDLLTFAVS